MWSGGSEAGRNSENASAAGPSIGSSRGRRRGGRLMSVRALQCDAVAMPLLHRIISSCRPFDKIGSYYALLIPFGPSLATSSIHVRPLPNPWRRSRLTRLKHEATLVAVVGNYASAMSALRKSISCWFMPRSPAGAQRSRGRGLVEALPLATKLQSRTQRSNRYQYKHSPLPSDIHHPSSDPPPHTWPMALTGPSPRTRAACPASG